MKFVDGPKTLTLQDKEEAIERLKRLDQRDKEIYEKRKAKNDFEDLIYKSREWIQDDKNSVFAPAALIEEYLANLTVHEDWLYEDGYDLPKQVYQDKIKDLMSFYGPARNRKQEKEARDEYYPIIKETMTNFTNTLEMMRKEMTWLNATHLDEVGEMMQNFTAFMVDSESSQELLSLSEDPYVPFKQVHDKFQKVAKKLERLYRTK